MIKTTAKDMYWSYYLALEQDMESMARYIEFDAPNFDTYSIELAHILLATSSEVDVVIKELCLLLDSEARTKNIDDYKKIIVEHSPTFIERKVFSKRYGLHLTPWSNWSGGTNPDWWRSYNNVKHERSNHFSEACLKHTLHSVAALLVTNLEYALYKNKAGPGGILVDMRSIVGQMYPASRLFQLDDLILSRRLTWSVRERT